MQKKIFLRFLSLFLTFSLSFTIVFSYQGYNVNAQEPIKGLTPFQEVTLAISLLVASGVTFSNSSDAREYATQLVYKEIYNDIKQVGTTAVNGVVNVTDELWTKVRSFAQSTFSVGYNKIYNQGIQDYLKKQVMPFPVNNTFSQELIIGSAKYTFTSKPSSMYGATYGDLNIYRNDVHLDQVQFEVNAQVGKDFAFNYTISSGAYSTQFYYYDKYAGYKTRNLEVNKSLSEVVPGADKYQEYIGNGELNVVDWDWTNSGTGTRAISVPGATTEEEEDIILGKRTGTGVTTDTIISDTIPTTGTGEGSTGSYTGVLQNILDGVRSIPQKLDMLLNPAVPQEIALDFSPLQIATQKFPFSIPWDLVNIVKSFQSSRSAPKWTVNFPKMYNMQGGTIEIDFAPFDKVAIILRYFLLVVFVWFLTAKTRDLIRG